jgi:hypothetical protein
MEKKNPCLELNPDQRRTSSLLQILRTIILLHLDVEKYKQTKTNSIAFAREQTIPTERQPLVSDVSAKVCG